MITRKALTLSDIQAIAAGAEAEAKKNDWKVSIAIVDDGGHLLHFQRLDGAPTQSTYISQGKAKAAAFSRKPTKGLEEVIGNGRTAFLTAAAVSDMVLLEGGEPIIVDGICIGAVGVSGVKSSDDSIIALAGIAKLGA